MDTIQGANFYHIYFTGNNHQDIFYSSHDFIQCINRLALAADATSTWVVAYIFHHNHIHLAVRTMDITRFMHYFRKSLTAWFHRGYDVTGSVGKRGYGKSVVKDEDDLADLVKYVLRNEVRHSISSDPFSARWSSIGGYFNEIDTAGCMNGDIKFVSKFLPANKELPDKFIMGPDGLIVPGSFLDKRVVEELFGSRKAFCEAVYTLSERERRIQAKAAFDEHKPEIRGGDKYVVPLKDSQLLDFVLGYIEKEFIGRTILNLSMDQKYEVAAVAKSIFKKVTFRQLGRVLCVPHSTLWGQIHP